MAWGLRLDFASCLSWFCPVGLVVRYSLLFLDGDLLETSCVRFVGCGSGFKGLVFKL